MGAGRIPGSPAYTPFSNGARTAAYAIRDLGSTNGTMVNDDPVPLGRDTVVPLADGDRIRIGAWTTIIVRSR